MPSILDETNVQYVDHEIYANHISRIEWVVVHRNDSTICESESSRRNDDENACLNHWSFVSVFNDSNHTLPESEVVVSLPVSQQKREFETTGNSTRSRQCCYYNRINLLYGCRIGDADDTENFPTLKKEPSSSSSSSMTRPNSKKRQRTTSMWKISVEKSASIAVGNAVDTDLSDALSLREIDVVDPRHLVPIYGCGTTKIPILVTDTTDVYRLLAASQLHVHTTSDSTKDDRTDLAVVEIGSSTGMTSEIVWRQLNVHNAPRRGRWIGFDTGADMVNIVHNKLKDVVNNNIDEWAVCHHIDPLLDPETALSLVQKHLCRDTPTNCTSATQKITVLIDIGGNREEGAILRMIDWVIRIFQSVPTQQLRLHQIIIKSQSIYKTLSTICKESHILPDNTREGKVLSIKDWYMNRLRVALRDSFPKHPLQAPKRRIPAATAATTAIPHGAVNERRLICRYHNYHKSGCAKKDTSTCPYDHDYCHVCLAQGHIARQCPIIFGYVESPINH
jgi:hypothetical protein